MTGPRTPAEPGEAIGSPIALASAIRGGGLRTGVYLAAALLSLVSLPLLVRHLGVSEFGRYVAVVTAVNIAGLVADLGLTSIGLRSYEDGHGELRGDRLVRAILGLRLAVSVLLFGGVVAFFALAGYPDRVVLGAAIAGLSLAPQAWQNVATVPLTAGGRFGAVALSEFVRSAAGTLVVLVLVLAGAGLPAFLALYPLQWVAAAVVAARALPGGWLRPEFGAEAWRPLVRIAAKLSAASAAHSLYFRVPVLVMAAAARPAQTGYFAISFRVVEFAAAVAGLLSSTALPSLSRSAAAHEHAAPRRLSPEAGQLVRLMAAAGLGAAVATVALASPLVHVIGGASASPAVSVLRIQALELAPLFLAFAFGSWLIAQRRDGAVLAANLTALAATLVLTIALVGPHQARGVALAAVLAEALFSVVLAFAVWRRARR